MSSLESVRKTDLGAVGAAEPAPEAEGGARSKQLRGMGYDEGAGALEPGATAVAAKVAEEKAPEKPKSAPEEYELAERLYNAGDFAEALGHYDACRRLEPSQSGVLSFNMAQCLRRLGRNGEAAVLYEAALASGDPVVAANKEEVQAHLAETSGRAVKEAIAAPATESEHDRKMFDAAEQAYRAKNFTAALEGYMAVWEDKGLTNDKRGPIAYNIAQCHRLLGSTVDASVWYKVALGSGMASSPQGKEIEARIAELEASLKPLLADPRALENGKGKGSKRGAAKDKPVDTTADARTKHEQASDLYAQGYYDAAADLYVEVYHDPAVDKALRGAIAYNLAQCFRMLGQATLAVRWYETALKHSEMEAHRADIEEHLTKLRASLGLTPAPAPTKAAAPGAGATG